MTLALPEEPMTLALPEELHVGFAQHLGCRDLRAYHGALARYFSKTTTVRIEALYRRERLFHAFVGSPFPRRLLRRCSVLPFRRRFCPSDYIDGIYPRDMADDLMIGRDGFGRPFVAVRYGIVSGRDVGSTCVTVLFKRYLGMDTWVQAGHACPGIIGPLLSTQRTLLSPRHKTEAAAKLERLIAGEDVDGFEGCRISICSP